MSLSIPVFWLSHPFLVILAVNGLLERLGMDIKYEM